MMNIFSVILITASPVWADEYALLTSSGNAKVQWTVVVDPNDPESIKSLPPGIWKKNDTGKSLYQGQDYDGAKFEVRKSTPTVIQIQAGEIGTPVNHE